MKTKIKNLFTTTQWVFGKYKYSWQLWAGLGTVIVISAATYTGALMLQQTKTAYKPTAPKTSSERGSTNMTDSTQTPSTNPLSDEEQKPSTNQPKIQQPKQSTQSDQKSSSPSKKPTTSSQSPAQTQQNNGSSPTPSIPPQQPASPSGQAVPRGDFGSWRHIFYDDFEKAAALGTWGEDWNAEKIVYTGAQGQQWRAYPKSYKDTYSKRPYRSDQVLSVKNSMLNFWLHNVEGQPAGANPSPIIANGSQYQTYGRYSARFKVDTPNLSEYYVAWLLWPQSERWPQDGEFDFPEGNLAGDVGGFHHYSGGGSCTNGCQDVANVPVGTKFTDWHTYTIEWTPGRIKYILDGNVVLDSTKWVPSGPMRWQLQTETNGNGTHSGNLMVDWVSVWRYQP